jgi:hypothetical protein
MRSKPALVTAPDAGSAEILVDNFNVAPAEVAQSISHGVLKSLTLEVVLNLIRRGLTHVQNRLAFDMMRLDLVTHRAPSPGI